MSEQPKKSVEQHEAAPADDARECLMDVVSHYRGLSTGLAFMLNQACVDKNADDEAYWKHEIKALDRMLAQAERALAAPLEGTGNGANEWAVNPIGYIRADDLKELAAGNGAIISPRSGATDVPVFARAPRTEVAGAVPEGWKLVPIERSYDMRVKAVIAFNTAEKDGKDRDDALDAAHKATLSAAPQLPSADAAAAPADERTALTFEEWFSSLSPQRRALIGDVRDARMGWEAARAAASQPAAAAGQEAVAWVRKHPDSGELSGDWLWNDAIEQCRKDSGVWLPLGYLTAPPAQVANRQGMTDRLLAEFGHELAKLLAIDSFDIADRDAQIRALLEGAKHE
ncbi:hypothetical protein ACW910_24355 (plasmid) [Burkholderia ambifaria]